MNVYQGPTVLNVKVAIPRGGGHRWVNGGSDGDADAVEIRFDNKYC